MGKNNLQSIISQYFIVFFSINIFLYMFYCVYTPVVNGLIPIVADPSNL